ncbi:V-type ATPase [Loa loa]|nr:V-type ATPase [Loa loa]EJD75960.1 V-type ATPase [Loa loa]
MGSLYRSEPMSLCQLFLHSEMAYDEIAKLGELGVVHFIDLNSEMNSFQRRFVGDLKRCNLMAQKLKFIEEQILADSIPVPQINGFVPAPPPSEMNTLEAEIEKIEEQLIENKRNMENLMDNYAQLNECMQCINKVQHLLTDEQRQQLKQSMLGMDQENLISGIDAIRRELTNVVIRKKDSIIPSRMSNIFSGENFIAGIVERRYTTALERLLWRTCGLNIFVRTVTIDFSEDPLLSDTPPKDVFMVFFSGEVLGLRVRKICKCYQAEIYDYKDPANDRVLHVTTLFGRVTEIKSVIEETRRYRNKLLQATACKAREWDIKLQKMSAVFGAMNMCNVDITQRYLIAECWIPTVDVTRVRNNFSKTSMEKNGSVLLSFLCEIETNKVPPTYFRVNKFTKVFQNIVNSYGTATYREINPALWTTITFPFLFAIMFGDAGHGLIMLFIALAFILFEKKIEIDDEIMGTFYHGRYVILLMGLFSLYTGFIYNDFYSRSMNLFGSSWRNPYDVSLFDLKPSEESAQIDLTLPPQYAYDRNKGPYVFGLDPVWNLAGNRLIFTNSMKMKTSVIFGIIQMTFGVMLNLLNFLYFRSTIDICSTFIPQILFLCCILIYLCIQITVKWLMFSTIPGDVFGFFYPGSHCAPSLLIGLINMCMLKPRKEGFWNLSSSSELEQCYLQAWYPNQGMVEKGLLILAILCIPVMLLVKPFYLKFKFWKIGDEEIANIDDSEVKCDFMDVFIYQAIHTIEFALGCISHTASYLRLWALSLAHAQLSEVLWSMVLGMAFSLNAWSSGPLLYLVSWLYGLLTFVILILMEGLSTFLHALRLHWVEFQSKFYDGHGYSFKPFAFAQMKSFKLVSKKDGSVTC